MLMLMMHIRQVVVAVFLGFVGVLMAVLPRWHGVVRMRVVPVRVAVGMGMRFSRVNVHVDMLLSDSEIGPQQHDCQRGQEKG